MDATNPPPGQARPARFWISLALLSAVVLVYVVLMNQRGGEPTGTTGPAIGRRLSYLRLEPLTGDPAPVTLDDLNGRVTLINFWGTWCPPCIRELPDIVDLGQRFADREAFRLYAVSCGPENDPQIDELREPTLTFLSAREMTLPTYADPQAATRSAMSVKLDIPIAYPTTLVLDREGIVRGCWQGYDARAAGDMEKLIEQLLSDSSSDDISPEGAPGD